MGQCLYNAGSWILNQPHVTFYCCQWVVKCRFRKFLYDLRPHEFCTLTSVLYLQVLLAAVVIVADVLRMEVCQSSQLISDNSLISITFSAVIISQYLQIVELFDQKTYNSCCCFCCWFRRPDYWHMNSLLAMSRYLSAILDFAWL